MKSFFSTVILTALFIVLLFSPMVAQEVWDNQVMGMPSVLFIDNTCHMWYTGNSPLPLGSIGYASSTDGITWEKNAANPVLVHEPSDEWNEVTVYEPNVNYDGSLFHMWYTSSNNPLLPGPIHIHHATSANGLTWSKDIDHNPVLSPGPSGSWDYQWIDSHCIIRVDTIYHMWYAGCNLKGVRIGHATSTDGINWTKDVNNPVLTFGTLGSWEYPRSEGRVEAPNVIYDGSTYHMWYSGGNHSRWQIGYATSSDGVNWTKYANNPVLKLGADGDWDDTWVGCCSVILDTVMSAFRMWYSGGDTSLIDQNPWRIVSRIGYATSADGINWTKYPNPVVTDITKQSQNILKGFELNQNYPNPFNPKTFISYQLPVGSEIDLSIFNILGQKVATLVAEKQMAGKYEVQWDASGFASGLYYYRIEAGDFVEARKMIYLK